MSAATRGPGAAGPCPAVDRLEGLVAVGSMDDELRAHVAQCAACGRALRRIREDNALLAELVAAAGLHCASAVRDKFAGYDVLEEIERGGQGVVYKAVHAASGTTVALKVLLAGPFATSSQRQRFEQEAEITAGLRHPNVVAVLGHGRSEDGHYYLAMEYVDGAPLLEHVRGIRRTDRSGIRQRLELFARVCDALATAHRRGIIHRDLKPSNILVDESGAPRVLDFGIAVHAPAGNPALDSSPPIVSGFCGTLAYAAPEQVLGRTAEVDARTDVYALGVILYEILTGRHPFHGHRAWLGGAAVASLVRSILHEHPRNPRSLNRAIDNDLKRIVLKAMARAPLHRHESAVALLADVRRHLDDWGRGASSVAR